MGGFLGRFSFDFNDADINMEGSAWANVSDPPKPWLLYSLDENVGGCEGLKVWFRSLREWGH